MEKGLKWGNDSSILPIKWEGQLLLHKVDVYNEYICNMQKPGDKDRLYRINMDLFKGSPAIWVAIWWYGTGCLGAYEETSEESLITQRRREAYLKSSCYSCRIWWPDRLSQRRQRDQKRQPFESVHLKSLRLKPAIDEWQRRTEYRGTRLGPLNDGTKPLTANAGIGYRRAWTPSHLWRRKVMKEGVTSYIMIWKADRRGWRPQEPI